jgi:hypothetical protein
LVAGAYLPGNMSQLEREYTDAKQALKAKMGHLIAAAEAADADCWGTDLFRRLRLYAGPSIWISTPTSFSEPKVRRRLADSNSLEQNLASISGWMSGRRRPTTTRSLRIH